LGTVEGRDRGRRTARHGKPGTALRCDGCKHGSGPGFQSNGPLTRQVATLWHPTVQTAARRAGDFFTWATASPRPAPCALPRRTRHTRRKGVTRPPRPGRVPVPVTALGTGCADSLKPGFRPLSATERPRGRRGEWPEGRAGRGRTAGGTRPDPDRQLNVPARD